MPLIATQGESKPKQLPPAGTHVARCYSVVDLGTQTLQYMGTEKEMRKIRVTWELPDERAVFDEEKGEQPFVLSKEYTLSLYEKANLRHDLESWRGKQFTAQELAGFDIFTLLGAPCLLSVIHKTTDKGKTFANIATVSKLPKGTICPPPVNQIVAYAISDLDGGEFNNLPQWLQDKIKASREWNAPPDERETDEQHEEDEDAIPF
jgi:hypothetical protein